MAAPPAAAGGPSEFTRILGRSAPPPGAPPASLPQMQLPPAQTPAAPVPAPAPAPAASAPPAQQTQTKSLLPVIIALNVILIGAIAVVLYFVLRK
jgi:hypothetical protein